MNEVKITDKEAICTFGGRNYEIPGYMRDSLEGYIKYGHPVGNFLEAVLCNKLYEVFASADDTNFANVPAYLYFLYNHAPASCWRSKEKYEAWMDHEGLSGIDKKRSAAR